jgi:hypothetical protein
MLKVYAHGNDLPVMTRMTQDAHYPLGCWRGEPSSRFDAECSLKEQMTLACWLFDAGLCYKAV